MLQRLNQTIDRFEPTIRLLYRIGIVCAIYYGLIYIGDSLFVPDSAQTETSCEAPPRLSG